MCRHCVVGIAANKERIARMLENSLMMVTALNPHIGYDRASKVATKALRENLSLKEAGEQLGFVTAQQFDRWVNPKAMLAPMKYVEPKDRKNGEGSCASIASVTK